MQSRVKEWVQGRPNHDPSTIMQSGCEAITAVSPRFGFDGATGTEVDGEDDIVDEEYEEPWDHKQRNIVIAMVVTTPLIVAACLAQVALLVLTINTCKDTLDTNEFGLKPRKTADEETP
ncbi:hypothetical protein QOT17_008865 [Balamuthia mandrillaris]